jgi:carbamoyltransferase
MAAFFKSLRDTRPVDEATKRWQESRLRFRNIANYTRFHHDAWRRVFGNIKFPPIVGIGHHYTHAMQAFMQSPFERAVCLTIDGSGDEHCTVVWRCEGDELQ